MQKNNDNVDDVRPYNKQPGSKPPGRRPLNNRSETVQISFKAPNKLRANLDKQVARLKKLGFRTTESELMRILIEDQVDNPRFLVLGADESGVEDDFEYAVGDRQP